ncbi:LytTR family DNA-binding domain-containing protein [Flammeovirgaceae bacterium SG7u.111]|nr:LytTR family DNA-binding domain-containing protein [Flammeovirgaceae bacterium SG7u.132]WPO38415.1 LytTR family DNA-binding domain-containing protein [Flammeovirgaceae bacterium SG7u.111]
MNCIAIDDEPLALELIERYIQKVPFLKLMGSFLSPFDALEMLNSTIVDLVFTDINMPDINGIDFVKSLCSQPKVIFTSAHSEYAIEGFDLDATDYLLKPYSFDRFLKAVNKANNKQDSSNIPQNAFLSDFIFVNSEHHMIKVALSDIYYIEGFKEYVKIYTSNERPILTIKSLKAFGEQLNSDLFIRTHRSYIVSIDKIQDIKNSRVKVKNNYLPIGSSFREQFNKFVLKGRV